MTTTRFCHGCGIGGFEHIFTFDMYVTFNHWSKNSLDSADVAGDSRQGELLRSSLRLQLREGATVLRHKGTNKRNQK